MRIYLPPSSRSGANGRRSGRGPRRRRGGFRLAVALVSVLVVVAIVVLAWTLPGKKSSGSHTSSTSAAAASSTSSSLSDANGTTTTGHSAADETTGSASAGTTGTSAASTGLSYSDAAGSVKISKASVGSGANKITYYVIDIRLTSAKALQAGLASDPSGAAFTSAIASANGAVFAINGDYFRDRTDGIIIRNGVVYRDKPARTGAAIFTDGSMKVFDETKTSAAELLAQGAWHTFSFGPVLVAAGKPTASGILNSYEVVPNPQYPIQGMHPRTGIGYVAPDHFILIDVDGRHPGYSRGMTLQEFAQLFKRLGCITAYNIDGGASATVYFQGRVINQPKNHTVDPVQERATSDILFIK